MKPTGAVHRFRITKDAGSLALRMEDLDTGIVYIHPKESGGHMMMVEEKAGIDGRKIMKITDCKTGAVRFVRVPAITDLSRGRHI